MEENPNKKGAEIKEEIKEEDMIPALKSIHTFNTDVADTVKTDGLSMSRILQAEQKRKQTEEEVSAPHYGKYGLLVFLGFVFIGLGIWSFYNFAYKQLLIKEVVVNKTASIMKTDSIVQFSVVPTRAIFKEKILQEFAKKRKGKVSRLIVSSLNPNTASSTHMDTTELFDLLSGPKNELLVHSLTDDPYIGIFYFDTLNYPFMLFTSTTFENTVAAMNLWEKNGMLVDMQDYFLENDKKLVEPLYNSTKNGESYTFEFALIQNKEVKVIKNARGEVVFLYGYPDNEHVMITNSTDAFKEVAGRLAEAKLSR